MSVKVARNPTSSDLARAKLCGIVLTGQNQSLFVQTKSLPRPSMGKRGQRLALSALHNCANVSLWVGAADMPLLD
jgi:hypothetical protein